MTRETAELFRRTAPYRVQRSARPARIETPGPGQESVWDYPRPPRVEDVARRVRVELDGQAVGETRAAKRVCETAGAPAYYLPPDDVDFSLLEPGASRGSICEWKGPAQYWHVIAGGRRIENAAWSYPDPFPGYETIRDYVSFYPARLACYVGDARAEPQPGAFYGGWVTPEIVGPIKGEPGSEGW